MRGDSFFLDTNILVYSFDAATPARQDKAQTLIAQALETDNGCISYQVVQEFLNVAIRKFPAPMPPATVRRYLAGVLMPLCRVFANGALYERALDVHERWRYAWYDALIIASALEAGCAVLYSEDLQDGQVIESLTIRNPFQPQRESKRRR